MAEPAWSPCLLTVNPVFLPRVQILASLVRKFLGISQVCLVPRIHITTPHVPQGFSPLPSRTWMNLPSYLFPPHRTWLHPGARSAQGCGHTHQETIKVWGMEQGRHFKGHMRRENFQARGCCNECQVQGTSCSFPWLGISRGHFIF